MADFVSQCYICQGVSLDAGYTNTIYFSDESAQQSYFKSKMKYHYTGLSYIRIFEGVIKVPNTPANMVNCNYVMFRNTSELWYYGFITSVDYYSSGRTDIHYEIDIIQTWMFVRDGLRGVVFNNCLVEREHAMSDAKWTHLLNEPFPLGDTTFDKQTDTLGSKSWKPWYLIQARSGPDIPSGARPDDVSAVNGNIYVGFIFIASSKNSAIDTCKKLQGSAVPDDNIINVQTIPEVLAATLSTIIVPGGKKLSNESYESYVTGQVSMRHSSIDGYTPKNNKCFNYPYYCFYVSNQKGMNAIYDFAYMSEGQRTSWVYKLYGDVGTNAGLILHPESYKGMGQAHDYDLLLGTLPVMQFASYYDNAFQQQELNARVQGATRLVEGGLNLVGSGASSAAAMANYKQMPSNMIDPMLGTKMGMAGAAVGMLLNSAIDSFNMDAIRAQQQNTPSNVHNLSGCSTMTYNIGSIKPVFAIRHMKRQFVEALDDFFEVYGYSCMKIKKPNISGRKAWNYVKTNGCSIRANMPGAIQAQFCAIHDRGITYWKNPDKVGDYSQDNSL